jgi:hypothetical protein
MKKKDIRERLHLKKKSGLVQVRLGRSGHVSTYRVLQDCCISQSFNKLELV